jgi:hypothetical protein
VGREERHANTAAADAFFAREWSADEVAEATKSMATPPELIAAWERDCAKARATYTLAEQQEELARLQKELARAKPGPKLRPTAREIEDARMDAVAKTINDRLRVTGQPRRPAYPDPAAPHPMLHPGMSPRGLNR